MRITLYRTVWVLLAAPLMLTPPAAAAAPQSNAASGGSLGGGMSVKTLGQTADEVRATQVVGRSLRARDGLGAGTITDLLANRRDNRIEFAVIDRNGAPFAKGKQYIVLAWNQLRPQHPRGAGYAVDLGNPTLDNAPTPAVATRSGQYFDLERDLIGREAKTANGSASLGKIADIVFDSANGRLDYLLVGGGGGPIAGASAPRAVAWSALASRPGAAPGTPAVLRLSPGEFASAPLFGLKAEVQPDLPVPVPRAGSSTEPLGNRTVSGPLKPQAPR